MSNSSRQQIKKPKLGQHFLNSEEIAAQIAGAADLSAGDTVLEIGPGKGILTEYLLQKAGSVVAVEKDSGLCEFLKRKFSGAKNFYLINADIRDFFQKPRNYELRIVNHGYKIVANIPYYLTSRLIKLILENPNPPRQIILTIQKEVAERICAAPPKMSILAVSVQIFGTPWIIKIIPAEYFSPPPEVDSVVLKITPSAAPLVSEENRKEFFRLVKIGFSSRRKQLINNLSSGFHMSRADAEKWLRVAGIDPTRRAETLTVGEWLNLANAAPANIS